MERVATIVGSLIGGIILGALPVWVLMQAPPEPSLANTPALDVQDKSERVPPEVVDEQMKAELRKARDDADAARRALSDAQDELRTARAERKDAQERATAAQAETTRLKEELEKAKAAAPAPDQPKSGAPITYGKWAEMPELRDANWAETGGAAKEMIPMLKLLAEHMAKGEQPPPALMQKIGEQNRKLVSLYAKVMGKLPTHSSVNGEFAHPFLLMNMLASQLEAAGEPLTAEQKAAIAKLGEDYDRRWDEQQKAYNENTFKLEKKLDEADLKEWFKAQMLAVCTPSQRAIAVPPEIDGLVGLDLYSSGLIFQMGIKPLTTSDEELLPELLKRMVAQSFGMELVALETATFVFDNWLHELRDLLVPKAIAQQTLYRTADVIRAGRAQLKACKVLYSDFAASQDIKDAIKGEEDVNLPLLTKE